MTPISIKTSIKQSLNPTYYLLLNYIHIILLLYKKNNSLTLCTQDVCFPPQKAHSLMLVPGFYLRQPFPALNGPFPSQPLLLRTPTTPSPLTKFPSTNYHAHYITSIPTKYHHLLITSIYQSILFIYSPYLLCHY